MDKLIRILAGLAIVQLVFVVFTNMGGHSLAGQAPNQPLLSFDKEQVDTLIIQGGKTRLRPVLLTAITTILGLVPMAIGLNINFETMLSEFNPHISFGGDMAAMWSPLSWTVIFGLTFATFLTLVIVPAMYRITTRIQIFVNDFRKK